MATELSLELLQKLPKTDLHVHLDGSLRLDTVIDLARKQKVKLPTEDREELFRMIYAGDVCNSLDDYLKAFDITLSVLQTEESLERAAFELAEDAWKENVRYIEVRYAPMLHTRWDTGLTAVVEAVLRGLRAAKRAFGIRYGVILCGIRSMSAESSVRMAELAIAFKNRGVQPMLEQNRRRCRISTQIVPRDFPPRDTPVRRRRVRLRQNCGAPPASCGHAGAVQSIIHQS